MSKNLICTSDLHNDVLLLEKIRRRWPDDVVVVAGDLTNNGTQEEYDRMEAALVEHPGGFLFVPGNHDYGCDGWHGVDQEAAGRAQRLFGIDAGEGRIVMEPEFDQNVLGIDSCQRRGKFTSRGCRDEEALALGYEFAKQVIDLLEPLVVICHHDPTLSCATLAHPWLDWPSGPGLINCVPAGSVIICGHVGGDVTIKCVKQGLMQDEGDVTVVNLDGCVGKQQVLVVRPVRRWGPPFPHTPELEIVQL